MNGRRALFLDRDGVLVDDTGALVSPTDIRLIDGAAEALLRAAQRGFALVVVTNQTVIARGLAGESEVAEVNRAIARAFQGLGVVIDAFYICPHHPNATVESYRLVCDCRKPRHGMLQRAAHDLTLDLVSSTMVGDRMSDVEAGARAGCKTVLVLSGKHLDPLIESPDPITASPDFVAENLGSAVAWMLGELS